MADESSRGTGPLLPGPTHSTPPRGAERRVHPRAVLNVLCDVDVPAFSFMFKAQIVDISAGGMRLRIPKIAPEYLLQPFYVQWKMGGGLVRGQVFHLYSYSENEIAVRFLKTGASFASAVSHFVDMTMRAKEKGMMLYDPPAAPSKSRAKSSGQPADPRDWHSSGLARWINKRIATHLPFDL